MFDRCFETGRFAWVRVGSAIGFSLTSVLAKATGVEDGRMRWVWSVLGSKPGTIQTHVDDGSDCAFLFVVV